MKIGLITYNVLFDKASLSLDSSLSPYRPDILCLQEVETKEQSLNRITNQRYRLANFSNSFIKFGKVYGLATYYNQEILTFVSSETFDLPRSVIEGLLVILRGGNNPRSVLKTDFKVKDTTQKLTVYNIHLSPWGSNGVRIKQLTETLDSLDLTKYNDTAIIVTGDFNFSYRRRKLEEIIHRYELKEATANIFYTFESTFLRFIPLRWKLDYILYKNITWLTTKALPIHFSDHYPIFAEFQLTI
ncbi:endonuclease/exonuclease/phosphatase family protein [Candidatus Roizmanbacteria bacterium]|nr:endonuclease/exonuclease/phosphatase family protein [Candidatus Roizmanbacteria bacterium]